MLSATPFLPEVSTFLMILEVCRWMSWPGRVRPCQPVGHDLLLVGRRKLFTSTCRLAGFAGTALLLLGETHLGLAVETHQAFSEAHLAGLAARLHVSASTSSKEFGVSP